MNQFTLEKFQGPLDLLLQLIEKEELSITEISLAVVTEQYLAFIDSQPDLPPDDMADFLVIAAKLLLIKSRVLLPQLFGPEEDDVGEELTRQLALYKMYVDAGLFLAGRLRAGKVSYGRERIVRNETVSFSPPPSLNGEVMKKAYEELLKELAAYVRPAPELISRAISLKERIAALRVILESAGEVNFHERILTEAKSRADMIVSFLALLELVKQRVVVAHQAGHGTNIVVSKAAAELIEAPR
jgi:segregation and condensation protein A